MGSFGGLGPVERVVGQDVETPLLFLLEPKVRDLVELHLSISFLFRHPLLPGVGFCIIPDLEALPLILLPEVSLVQALFILNLHVHRVVHQPLTIDRGHNRMISTSRRRSAISSLGLDHEPFAPQCESYSQSANQKDIKIEKAGKLSSLRAEKGITSGMSGLT